MVYFKRGSNKVQVDYTSKDVFKFYKDKYSGKISNKKFRKILQEYNQEILRMIVFDGLDYSMGYRLGSIRIKKFDNSLKLNEDGEIANKLRPNWDKTLKKWSELYPDKTPEEIKEIPDKPVVYHLNEHTDGVVFRWFWDKVTSNIKNQSAYKFEPVRAIKREAAKAWKNIPNLKNLYYE